MQKSLGYHTMPHTWLLDVLEGLKSSTNQTKAVDLDFSSSNGSDLAFETKKVTILLMERCQLHAHIDKLPKYPPNLVI